MDVFSYGVLLWELVTKEVPRRGHLRPVRVPEECAILPLQRCTQIPEFIGRMRYTGCRCRFLKRWKS